jgi:hypothetical protein
MLLAFGVDCDRLDQPQVALTTCAIFAISALALSFTRTRSDVLLISSTSAHGRAASAGFSAAAHVASHVNPWNPYVSDVRTAPVAPLVVDMPIPVTCE